MQTKTIEEIYKNRNCLTCGNIREHNYPHHCATYCNMYNKVVDLDKIDIEVDYACPMWIQDR
jgi:hypothetical protein